MKIEIDEYGCCLSITCPFAGECAQHRSAGDFRTESGFSPELQENNGEVICLTADQPVKPLEYCGVFKATIPNNYEELGIGFLTKEQLEKLTTTRRIIIDGREVLVPIECEDLYTMLQRHKEIIEIN